MAAMVRDAMTREPFTVRPDTPVDAVVALLKDRGFRHLPVVTAEGQLVGIVTDRDVVGRATASASWLPDDEQASMLHDMHVAEIATEDPVHVSPDTSLRDAARLLLDLHVSCLPVVEGGLLVGVLTTSDVVRTVAHGATSG